METGCGLYLQGQIDKSTLKLIEKKETQKLKLIRKQIF